MKIDTMNYFRTLLLTLLVSFTLFACSAQKKHKPKKHYEAENPSTMTTPGAPVNCDTSLWKYVYNRSRLQVLQECKTVTGTITESNADDDGDQHMLLQLDAGQENLLTSRNIKKKDGCLVIEAVCVNNVKLKKVGTTCEGYVNNITLPKVGDKVKVTGSLVIDSHNGWSEIHPITKLEITK
jgi:hypothetical protein